MRDTGQTAFPYAVPSHGLQHTEPGMSLRDYFAGQALAGIASIAAEGFSLPPEQEAEWAYQRADAMLAARNTKEGGV